MRFRSHNLPGFPTPADGTGPDGHPSPTMRATRRTHPWPAAGGGAEPAVAALLGVVVLGETLGGVALGGLALLAGSLLLLLRPD